MNTYKIAIIGATGFATEKMLPQLQASEVCKVVAIQARDENKLKQVAEQFGVEKYFTDVGEMLQSDTFDLVYIATPPYMHLENIRIAIESGTVKNILCEKPLVLTEDELKALTALSEQNPNTKIFVGHHIRHQKAIKDIRDIISSNQIGEVVFAEGGWGYNLDPEAPYAKWKLDQSKGGSSVMGDPGIHVIDVMYALFGNPDFVVAKGASVVYKTTIDNVTALFGYQNTQVKITASQTSMFPKNDLIIEGTKGRIEVPECFSQTYIPEVRVTTAQGIEVKKYDETLLYKNEVENILGISTEGISATTLTEGVEENRILIEINKQVTV